jgi:hypothetical protein
MTENNPKIRDNAIVKNRVNDKYKVFLLQKSLIDCFNNSFIFIHYLTTPILLQF